VVQYLSKNKKTDPNHAIIHFPSQSWLPMHNKLAHRRNECYAPTAQQVAKCSTSTSKCDPLVKYAACASLNQKNQIYLLPSVVASAVLRIRVLRQSMQIR
jgi:hypothetical protein